MKNYIPAEKSNWFGRESDEQLYLHEKVKFETLDMVSLELEKKRIGLLGYACDEGVRRNQGRIGASKGPDAIRQQLGKMPNHLDSHTELIDFGNLLCQNQDLELIQEQVIETIEKLNQAQVFSIILGGGHDLAYAHFTGLAKSLPSHKKIGIINFDAHLDMRPNVTNNNSGTPFYQIAQELKNEGKDFKYFCIGMRQDSNDRQLIQLAEEAGAVYLERNYFEMSYLEHVQLRIMQFLEDVDLIYTTIDLDGFSSAYAPGVSAASPMGFFPDIVLESLKLILESKKLVGIDVVELNPDFDCDNQTAKLAASLIHYTLQSL
ncbi:MAG: formimidoylglutamase [Maribacter sp.]